MSFLRGSANYVWCTTSVLGKGATGAVYQGVNKVNGEPVAVKTFNQLSHMRPQDVQMREFEVLRKVKHENIVKLLAIEEEQPDSQRTSGKVIVMELCTGGSLFNILDDPENTYGLQEEEFLWVLEHLSAGMKHLRDNNLVHRDLKPGNIMKFIREDGTTIYKLTDFGAARELQEDQQFVSLYGTEEYLHPDMYERAVLRKPVGKTFGATVDLWSIGVTLYHVATGNLPFRPFGGRRNKETMFYITTKKASGVISGLQVKDNGPIEWSRELPNNCQLSTGLKKIVTPLLAGLLEVDPQRIWNFDRFFTEVTNTLSRKPLHVFHVNNASSIKIYVSPDDTYEQIQLHVMEQTSIQPDSQILLYHNGLLLDVIDENTRGCGYPQTKDEEPLMLFSKENNNIVLPIEIDIPKFPEFPNLVSVENDAAQAKLSCSTGHVCKRRIEKVTHSYTLISESVNQLSNYILSLLKELNQRCNHLTEITANKKQTVSSIQLSQNTMNVLLSLLKQSVNNMPDLNWTLNLDEISDLFLLETYPKVAQLQQKNVVENNLKLEWLSVSRTVNSPADTRCPQRARTQVERLRDSWQHLLRDRATRSLSYNDEQFHVLERIKISETGRRLKTLLDVDSVPAFNQLAEFLGDWYKIAQTIFLQTQILQKDVDSYERKLEEFSECLTRETSSYEDELKSVLQQVTTGATSTKKSVKYSEGTKLKNSFNEFVRIKDDIVKIVGESTNIIEQYDKTLALYKDSVTENQENNQYFDKNI